jgi:hypothetical protein
MQVEDSSRNTALHLIVQSQNIPLLKVAAEFNPDYTKTNN